MSTLAVVEAILREAAMPLSVREIVERAGDALPTKSKTPDTVVARDLSMDIKKKAEASTFVRTSPGRYGIRDQVARQNIEAAQPGVMAPGEPVASDGAVEAAPAVAMEAVPVALASPSEGESVAPAETIVPAEVEPVTAVAPVATVIAPLPAVAPVPTPVTSVASPVATPVGPMAALAGVASAPGTGLADPPTTPLVGQSLAHDRQGARPAPAKAPSNSEDTPMSA